MTRYHDRGNLKWLPFLMPEHIQLLKAYYLEIHQIDLPIIDEQLQYPWQFLLEQALIEGTELEITYHSKRGYVTTSGFIEQVHRERAYLVLRGLSRIEIPLGRIIRIENG
ncbi:YolD-like family protein [Exiguobacterium antarcticum]|uniref:YolD-like family protein n=1 Tax=Exiguobacterium antarcticum TaxID=132920 RepID=A0ABT6R5Q0_9BACL|nr:YolD-like family protein [Exiguobacterium antarcticum]MDI3236287.1 YolD-like family protein [Exiguobacterium antarcticum]